MCKDLAYVLASETGLNSRSGLTGLGVLTFQGRAKPFLFRGIFLDKDGEPPPLVKGGKTPYSYMKL